MKKTIRKVLALVLALACVMSIGFVSVLADGLDGTYSVPVRLWKESRDEDSMAQVVGDTATVVINGDQATITVPTKQMEMMGIKGDLVGLRADNGNGGFVTATSTGNNADGNPAGFTFTVPVSVYQTGNITVKESAKTTPNFEAMNSEQTARLHFDLANAKKTASAQPAATTASSSTSSSNPLSQIFSQITSLFNK